MMPNKYTQAIEIFIFYLFNFTYFYPLFMAYIWMSGSLIYYFRWEKPLGFDIGSPPALEKWPGVSFLIPCHNEGSNIVETISWIKKTYYPNYEIIAINDGSTDNTGEILDNLLGEIKELRVIHLATNQGKAKGLNMAALSAKNDFLLCVDGDVVLDPWAAHWMVWHMATSPRVGAVTGNPRIRNRSTLLGKLQVGEFSSIIGLIKRAQRVYGRIFTASGAIVAFRRSALQQINFWDQDMITEDISISWKLQLSCWDIRYETHALCWLLMPETFKGLWKQRLRWAQGGMEVFSRYWKTILTNWKCRRMLPVLMEYVVSVVWAYSMVAMTILWMIGKIVDNATPYNMPHWLAVSKILPDWSSVVLAATCLVQFAVSMYFDGKYDIKMGKQYYWIIWYPVAYWVLNVLTVTVGVPKALLKPKGQRAVWTSPDRGIHNKK
jgi:biofilm PGA synthesis N-glycosyltransferase PgaC